MHLLFVGAFYLQLLFSIEDADSIRGQWEWPVHAALTMLSVLASALEVSRKWPLFTPSFGFEGSGFRIRG